MLCETTNFFTLKFIAILGTDANYFRFTLFFYKAVKEELEYVLPFTLYVFKTIVYMLFCSCI